jgi:hypothetical protein
MTDDEFDDLIQALWDKHSNAEGVMDEFEFYDAAHKIRAQLTDPTP